MNPDASPFSPSGGASSLSSPSRPGTCTDLAQHKNSPKGHSNSSDQQISRKGKQRKGSEGLSRSRPHSSRGNDGGHLLNFQYHTPPPRSIGQRHSPSSSVGRKHNPPQRSGNVKKPSLSSKYKLIVSESVINATPPWLLDPDISIPWDDVQAIISFDPSPKYNKSLTCGLLPLDELHPCPICLDQPMLPVMTRCGHIYCICCILRYMDQEFNRKCPMCSVIVSRSDLKEVFPPPFPLYHSVTPIQPQTPATFSLLIRLNGSISSFRASILTDSSYPMDTLSLPPSYNSNDMIYSRSCIASAEEIQSLWESRTQEIKRYREICLASAQQFERIEKEKNSQLQESNHKGRSRGWESVDLSESNLVTPAQPRPIDLPNVIQGDVEYLPFLPEAEELVRQKIVSTFSHKLSAIPSHFTRSDNLGLRREDVIYSYQLAPDEGKENVQVDPPTFLHPFCVRCLVSDMSDSEALDSFSGLLSLPHIITGSVLEVTTDIVTENGRKRYPFIRHLPLDSLYQLVEIDLTDSLSPQTFERYRSEFHDRNAKRNERNSEKERVEKIDRERREILERLEIEDRKERYERQQQTQREAISSLLQGPSLKTAVEEEPPAVLGGEEASTENLKHSFAIVTQMGGNFPSLADASKQPTKQTAHRQPKTCWGLPEKSVTPAEASPQQVKKKSTRKKAQMVPLDFNFT